MKTIKKSFFLVMLTIFTLFLFSISAYAANESSIKDLREIENVKQYNGLREARVTGSPRGRLISSVEITLTNKGHGTIGIYSDILCHEPVKELRMWLFLEQWIPEDDDWVTIRPDQFEWMAENFPDQDLTMAIATYDISRLERGRDYRVRGLFGADGFNAGLSETWSINTPNFFLE